MKQETCAGAHDGVPETDLITARLQLHARRSPLQPAYIFLRDDGRIEQIGYQSLERRAHALAGILAQRLAPGARALLLYPAGLDFIVAYFACLLAGVIAVPATMPHKSRASLRLKAVLADADPALVLTCSDCEAAVRASLVLAGAGCRACLATDALTPGEAPPPLPQVRAGMTAFLQYTSGSTSLPKGVEVTHANLASNLEAIRKGFGFSPGSVMVSWLPLFHDMGLIGSVLAPMFTGFLCVLMAPATFLRNPVLWLEAVTRYRGTCAGAPNFGWDYCSKKITDSQKAGLDLSSLTLAYNGSEPIRASTLDAFHQAFEGCGLQRSALFSCYGMAEATLFIAGGASPSIYSASKSLLEGNQLRSAPPGSADAREIVGCGRPADGVTLLIVDPDSCLPVSGRRVGEVWLAGPSVARGYWNRPQESAAAFGARLASGAGPFLRSGDLGFMRDGELFITGRLKDLIIINGRNLYPQDVEEVIDRSIDFIEPNMCAAFSVEIDGQERLAVVAEANRGLVRAAQQRDDVPSGVAERRRGGDGYLARIEALAHHICLVIGRQFEVAVSSIVFVKPGTFPRTSSGKVQRARCKEMALKGQLQLVYVMPGSIFDQRAVPAVARAALPARAAEPDAAHGADAQASRAAADAMIAWFRQYAARRLNSRLIDERRTIPPYVVLDLGNHGFFGLQVPKRYGGCALSTSDLMRVLEQLAAVDLTLAAMVGVHNGLGVRPVLSFGSSAMRARLLPALAAGRQLAAFALTEPEAGSNPLAMRASATRTEGGWRLRAEKQWIGLGAWAGVTTVFARACDAAGAPLGVLALVVTEDTPGLTQGPEALTMGMRGMVQNTLLLDDAFAPDEAVLLAPGQGMEVARDAMMFCRLGIGAMCVGAMKRCAQLMGRYAGRREIATGPLLDNPVTVARLHELSCAILATEALVLAIARQLDAGRTVPPEIYLACKISGAELLGQAADRLVQLLGGRGYIESNGAPQILRDARVLRILEGPSETLAMHLGAALGQPDSLAGPFIALGLGRPGVAAELAAALAAVKAVRREGAPLFAGDAALTQWRDYRSGELGAAAILLAAAESAQDEAAADAVAWARRRMHALSAQIVEELGEQPAHGPGAALLQRIERYGAAIGDVEQQLAGEGQGLDAALRLAAPRALAPHRPQPASAAPAAPAAPASPASPAAPAAPAPLTPSQRMVRDSVMQSLRAERGAAPGPIGVDTPFASLGMDSLSAASIACALEERCGIPITSELLYDFQTVSALADYIDARARQPELAAGAAVPAPQ